MICNITNEFLSKNASEQDQKVAGGCGGDDKRIVEVLETDRVDLRSI